MNRKLSLATLVALIASLFTASTAMAGDGTNLLQYMPSNSVMVVNVDVDRARNAPVFQSVLSMITGSSEYTEIMTEMQAEGVTFDPATGIHTIMMGTPNLDNAEEQMVFALELDLDVTQLSSAIAAQGELTSATVGTATTWSDGEMTLAHTGGSVYLLGTPALIDAVLAGQGGPTGQVGTWANGLDRGHTLWFSMTAPPGTPGITGMRGYLDVQAGVDAMLTATATSAEEAAAAVSQFDAMKAEAAADPMIAQFGLASTIQGATATANGADVTVTASIDASTWSTLSATLTALLAAEL